MTLSLVAIVLLGIAVGGWIYLDTRYQRSTKRWSRRHANLAVHQERVAESREDNAEEERRVADHLLVNELIDEEEESTPDPSSFVLQITGCVLVCVLGFLGYLLWGDLGAPNLETIVQQFDELAAMGSDARQTKLEKLISQLEDRNNSRHRSVGSSDYLIFAHSLNRDMAGVIRTHKLAESRNLTSLGSDLERIQAEMTVSDTITAEARRVADRVLAVFPEHPAIMQLFGITAYHDQDYIQARQHFERGVRTAADPSRARLLEELLIRTNENLAADHAGIRVNVDVQAEITTNVWLTVFAQTEENTPPLAVVQRPFVRNTEYQLLLDDAVSMLPNTVLSNTNRARVIARLTTTPEVTGSNMLQEVSSGWLDPTTRPIVSLVLSDTSIDDGIALSIHLGPDIKAEDNATVFVIGYEVGSSEGRPPLIVKRVWKRDLPLDVILTVDDAMLPLSEFPKEGLEVYARLSRTGNTTRTENDVESKRTQVQVGQSANLVLENVVPEQEVLDNDSDTGP